MLRCSQGLRDKPERRNKMKTSKDVKASKTSDKTNRRGRKPAPKGETKAQKFERLASARVTKALESIRLVGSLTGPTYEHTPKHVAAIETALRSAVEKAIEGLRNPSSNDQNGFSF